MVKHPDFITAALMEDLRGKGDITSDTLIGKRRIDAIIVAKEEGVLSGLETIDKTFERLIEIYPERYYQKPDVTVLKKNAEKVKPREVICRITGDARIILACERTILNILSHLSGVATLTSRFAEKVNGTKILDTRKTTPGMREAEKKATRDGGAENHRMGLFDMMLIKDNHIKIAGGIDNILKILENKRKSIETKVEIEVSSLDELKKVLPHRFDRIMLDNFTPGMVREAVGMRKEMGIDVDFELSGGVKLDNIEEFARTGIEYISVGALTHSANGLDMSLEVERVYE